MRNKILLYVGSIVIFLWGVAHIIPTNAVVAGFGSISEDNRLLITMEWVAEGLTLCFIGALVSYVILRAGSANPVSIVVVRASALMLLVMAVWTAVTGARTPSIPIKICPVVKTVVAILFVVATLMASKRDVVDRPSRQ